MRRPPTGIALALGLVACLDRPAARRLPDGGNGGAPALASRFARIDAATEHPSEAELWGLGPPEAPAPREAPEPEAHEMEDEPSEGNGSGFGRGVGGLGPPIARPPDVIPVSSSVEGWLDKEIVRRVVRHHIDEMKSCYERELVKNRRLRGEAMFQFTISPDGLVTAARLQRSTLRSPRTAGCVVAAIRTWQFPHPLEPHDVAVSYLFYFVPGRREKVRG
jgi:hypothetical protein